MARMIHHLKYFLFLEKQTVFRTIVLVIFLLVCTSRHKECVFQRVVVFALEADAEQVTVAARGQ